MGIRRTKMSNYKFLETMSLEEKLGYLYHICDHLCYNYELEHKSLFVTVEQHDQAWYVTDGWYAGDITDTIDGKCSLFKSMNFDMEQCEKDTNEMIKVFSGLLEPVEPKILPKMLKGVLTHE